MAHEHIAAEQVLLRLGRTAVDGDTTGQAAFSLDDAALHGEQPSGSGDERALGLEVSHGRSLIEDHGLAVDGDGNRPLAAEGDPQQQR